MATQDLGGLGFSEGAPVFIKWRWYHNLPGLPLWIWLLLAVMLPHNRHRQAWLILLLPLLAAGFALFIQLLIPESSGAESFGQFVVALSIAWTSVWLIGPWVQHGGQLRRLLSACGVMFAVGLVGYLGFYGMWVSSDVTWPVMGCWAVCSIALVAATALTGCCVGSDCSPRQLVFWPILWLPVTSALCVSLFLISMIVVLGGPGASLLESLVTILFSGLMTSVVLAGALYLVDLPLILLSIYNGCYRDRFCGIFCRHDRAAVTAVTAQEQANEHVSSNPFRV